MLLAMDVCSSPAQDNHYAHPNSARELRVRRFLPTVTKDQQFHRRLCSVTTTCYLTGMASDTGTGPIMEAPIIEAVAVEKAFGPTTAVAGLSFTIPSGTCTGLFGPNGAGKTTTMRMIMRLTRPTGGAVSVFGQPAQGLARADRARIGLVPQENTLDPELSVSHNLELYGRYYGLARGNIAERVQELLAFMQLDGKADARVNELSGGMKRRLVIARALIADPDLVILDEPTTGLDPQARVLIWRQLQSLKEVGKMMAYSAMFAASFETTIGAFARFNLQRTWDATLATPSAWSSCSWASSSGPLPRPPSPPFVCSSSAPSGAACPIFWEHSSPCRSWCWPAWALPPSGSAARRTPGAGSSFPTSSPSG